MWQDWAAGLPGLQDARERLAARVRRESLGKRRLLNPLMGELRVMLSLRCVMGYNSIFPTRL